MTDPICKGRCSAQVDMASGQLSPCTGHMVDSSATEESHKLNETKEVALYDFFHIKLLCYE